jgi:hypothetical protein
VDALAQSQAQHKGTKTPRRCKSVRPRQEREQPALCSEPFESQQCSVTFPESLFNEALLIILCALVSLCWMDLVASLHAIPRPGQSPSKCSLGFAFRALRLSRFILPTEAKLDIFTADQAHHTGRPLALKFSSPRAY